MDDVSPEFPGAAVPTSCGAVFVRHHESGVAVPLSSKHTVDTAAQPVVFVHGLGGESLDWADVVSELGAEVDAYALDLPGFGASPPPSDHDASLDAHVRAVVDVIDASGRAPVHLVGNSLGGAIATRVAAEHPNRVRSLALISPALPDLRPRLWSWQLLVALIPGLGSRIVQQALQGNPERMARRVFWLCYGNPSSVSDRRRIELVEATRRRAELVHSASTYQASLRALVSAYLQRGDRRLWRQAEQVVVRTMVIYGGRDKLVDPRMAARARRTFPDVQTLLMPDAGHVAQLEYPQRVANALRDFFVSVDQLRTPTPGSGNDRTAWDR